MINEEEVKHVAELARLELTDEELSTFSKQLNDVIDYFKMLDEVKTDNVEPSFHPLRTENRLREDETGKCLDRKKVLETAVHSENEYFKAPRIT